MTFFTHKAGTASEKSEFCRSLMRKFVWPASKQIIYLIVVLAIVAAGLIGIEQFAKWALKRSHVGAVYPNDISMARRDFNRPVSHYDYDFTPGVCLEYNILKGNNYEYANSAGMREPREVPIEKPADEFRIFLAGGSTAYGMGAIGEAAPAMGWYAIPYIETISHIMEMILNATAPLEGKRIRVYNAAVWGYAYQHNLMRYIAKLRKYNPDLIVSLDGANELPIICKLTPDWDYFAEGQFHDILKDIYAYNGLGLSSYITLWLKNNTYLMAYLWSGRDLFQELHSVVEVKPDTSGPDGRSPEGRRTVDEMSRRLDRNIETVVKVVENYRAAMAIDGVPHIIALQPWFYTTKKPLHEKEKLLASLKGYRDYYGVPSDKVYMLLVQRLIESAQRHGYFLVDFSDYFDDVSEWVFTDWCHLTAGANYLLAKELSNLVKEHFLGQALNPGDHVTEKNAYFWDLAASGKILYAPEPKGPQYHARCMLAGYPGESLYVSKNLDAGDRAEVVLDMGELRQISRMRLVWGDDATTPSAWEVDISSDQRDWRPFARGTKAEQDNYSRWPGFEYYTPAPATGRFLRYRPLGDDPKVIALRSWTVYR